MTVKRSKVFLASRLLALAVMMAGCGGEEGAGGAFPAGTDAPSPGPLPAGPGGATGAGNGTAGASGPSGTPPPSPAPRPAPGSGDALPDTETFPSGVYYAAPGAALTLVGAGTIPAHLGVEGGFDVGVATYVTVETPAAGDDPQRLVLASRDGRMRRTIVLDGVFAAARPALSPDESLVVFEARAAANRGMDEDFDLWSMDLTTAEGTGTMPKRLTSSPKNERGASWMALTRRIAYAASDAAGGEIHLYDVPSGKDLLTIPGVGKIARVAVAPDDTEIFAPEALRGYDAVSGALTRDLTGKVTQPVVDGVYGMSGAELFLEARVSGVAGDASVLLEVLLDGSKVTAVSPALTPAQALSPKRRP